MDHATNRAHFIAKFGTPKQIDDNRLHLHPDSIVRRAVASRDSSSKYQDQLAVDPDSGVRAWIAAKRRYQAS